MSHLNPPDSTLPQLRSLTLLCFIKNPPVVLPRFNGRRRRRPSSICMRRCPAGGAAPGNGTRFLLMHLALKRYSLRHQTN